MSKQLLFALLVVSASQAQAATPCGAFADGKSENRLVFYTDGSAIESDKAGIVRAVLQHTKKDALVFVRNVEIDADETYRLSTDGSELKAVGNTWNDGVYVREEPYTCAARPELEGLAKPGCELGHDDRCCAQGDARACVRVAKDKGARRELERLCASRADACLALMDIDERAANPKNGELNLYAEKKPLPVDRLTEVSAMCSRLKTPELCRKAAEQAWRGHQFVMARDIVRKMCDARLDELACGRARVLDALELPAVLPAARALPCGTFVSTGSPLTGDVTFADRGLMTLGMGNKARARLEDDRVKVRHDKGGDFIFAVLGPDLLLGMDDWNQFGIYQRTKIPKKGCAAPVTYDEQPLSSGCGLGQEPAACCRAGDTQGCNRLGSILALQGNWRAAATSYAKVCEKGVRAGCENWIYTVGKTGDAAGVEKGLVRLCRKSKQHIACDVLDTTNFGMLKLTYELEKAAPK